MAKLPFQTRAKVSSGQVSAGVGVSSRPQSALICNPKPPPPPSKNDHSKVDKSKKRHSEGENAKEVDRKKKKVVSDDDVTVDAIASAFGGLASRHFTELDLNVRRGRNDEDEEMALKSAMGDVFYHGLRVLSRKNFAIKEQEMMNKKLAIEIGNLNLKLSESSKVAAEEARLLKEELEKVKAERAKDKVDHDRIVRVIGDDLASTQGELSELKASFEKVSGEQYDAGYLYYLRTFLAADPEYSWSKFPPFTPAFMEQFKADNVVSIKEAKDALDIQFQEEVGKAATWGVLDVVDGSPSHQAAS